MGIDATRKWASEGFTRPWPDEIVMDSKTKALVDSKWKALAKELGHRVDPRSDGARETTGCRCPSSTTHTRQHVSTGKRGYLGNRRIGRGPLAQIEDRPAVGFDPPHEPAIGAETDTSSGNVSPSPRSRLQNNAAAASISLAIEAARIVSPANSRISSANLKKNSSNFDRFLHRTVLNLANSFCYKGFPITGGSTVQIVGTGVFVSASKCAARRLRCALTVALLAGLAPLASAQAHAWRDHRHGD